VHRNRELSDHSNAEQQKETARSACGFSGAESQVLGGLFLTYTINRSAVQHAFGSVAILLTSPWAAGKPLC